MILFDQQAKRIGVPRRYQLANAMDLHGPGRAYAAASDAMLSLFPGLRFSDRSFMLGGMIGLIGARGTGKTHMACGLVNVFNSLPHKATTERIVNGFRWARYRRALDIFSELKATFGRRDGEAQAEIIEGFVTCNLLVIDEVQVRSDTAWENSVLTNLVDQRYAAMRPTVLISNLNAGAFIDCIGDSIASRLVEVGTIIEASWPSFRQPAA